MWSPICSVMNYDSPPTYLIYLTDDRRFVAYSDFIISEFLKCVASFLEMIVEFPGVLGADDYNFISYFITECYVQESDSRFHLAESMSYLGA